MSSTAHTRQLGESGPSSRVAEMAKTGDLEKIRPAFSDLTNACKACHEKFRKD